MKIRDISHHDTDDGNTISLSGYDGFLVKATEGTGYVDPKVDFNVASVKSLGKPFGLYHYLSFQSDVKEQISAFQAQISRFPEATLRPALDVEFDDRINQILPSDIGSRLLAFYGAFPMIMLYANPNMISSIEKLVPGIASKVPLWLAEYNPNPRDISGYTRIGWQYREDPDESTFTDDILISKSVSSAPVEPAKVIDNGSRPAPDFPLPSGSYFGPKSGPSTSVSGYYSHRSDLAMWQQRMMDRGWNLVADGLYGDETANVTKKFQAEKGYTVDGLIGPQTWSGAWTEPIT